jgi:hypothetical protein
MMKNIQVIDGADNCTYDIFSVDDDDFRSIFPDDEQDIEFIEDYVERVGDREAARILSGVWTRPVSKKLVCGIHGTLFFELSIKKPFYPTKRESEMATGI